MHFLLKRLDSTAKELEVMVALEFRNTHIVRQLQIATPSCAGKLI